jgi:hypothetical protein
VGPRAGLDGVEKRETCPYGDSNWEDHCHLGLSHSKIAEPEYSGVGSTACYAGRGCVSECGQYKVMVGGLLYGEKGKDRTKTSRYNVSQL